MNAKYGKLYSFEIYEISQDEASELEYGKAYGLTFGGAMVAKTQDSIRQAIGSLEEIAQMGGAGSFRLFNWGTMQVLVVLLHPPALSGTELLKTMLDCCEEEVNNILALDEIAKAGLGGLFSVS